MWVFGKLRESMESIPLELSRYLGTSEEDIFLSSKGGLSYNLNLHNNILTPDKIPEFCLPPRLCKRGMQLEAETAAPYLHRQNQMPKSRSSSNNTLQKPKMKDTRMKNGDVSMAWKATKKPLPFSAEGYGLAGIYESPNTRRKESLFHSKCPVYMFDRSLPTAAPRLAKVTNLPKKTVSFFHLFSSKSLSETGSPGSETLSSSGSSLLSSPYNAKSSLYFPLSSVHLKGATSCPSLIDSRVDSGRRKKGGLSLTTSPSSPSSSKGSSLTLAPPVLIPLDVLQCQERLQHDHVLSLQGRGKVHLFAEHSTFTTNPFPSLFTVRVHVVSVEGLWEDTDRGTLNCAVSLCLTPGKLQQQESATIRNCHSLVFNKDFFFTELSREDLLELQFRLKVVDKPAAGKLRRGTVIGVISKPLSQLLSIKKRVGE